MTTKIILHTIMIILMIILMIIDHPHDHPHGHTHDHPHDHPHGHHNLLDAQGQGDVEEAPPVFTELLELTEYRDGVKEWKEVAR